MSKYDNVWKFVHKHPWISYWTVTLVVNKVINGITDIVTVLRTGQLPDRSTAVGSSYISNDEPVNEESTEETATEEVVTEEKESEEAPEAE